MKKTHLKRIRLLQRRGLLYAFLLCVFLMLLGGLGFWLLEPRAVTFSDGLWLAFTTAATVGYGDIVPSTHASRAFAIVVVFFGLS
ncbi:MAG TPA: potassium channel family protein, partial [Burkholderiaceae bacterium]|nr:potassium channel family protein [Burkholderiaceae bacterium]